MTPPTARALHLPDLPEVAVQIGAAAPSALDVAPAGPPGPRPRPALGYRLQQALASYLPLLLMGLLALGTTWLVQHTPVPPGPAGVRPVREAPDYAMTGFAVQRFGPDGREVLRISGDRLLHYPSTDQVEIEGVRIQALAPDGRRSDAVAKRALVNGDASEVQLLGGPRSPASWAPATCWRCAASSCMPSCASSGCARTCRCRSSAAPASPAPAAWTTITWSAA